MKNFNLILFYVCYLRNSTALQTPSHPSFLSHSTEINISQLYPYLEHFLCFFLSA